MNIFIADIRGGKAVLTADESWHCSKVLRKKPGDRVQLIDGRGNFYEGILELVAEKESLVKITGGPTPQAGRNYYLHLAIAPTKQIDRIEWMIEKAVEIGIDEISFVLCKNSERTIVKTDRVNKIVESAVKQSLQALIPKVNELRSLKDLLAVRADQKLIAHCFEGQKENIRTVTFSNQSTLVLVGPEGDFTLEEVALAESHEFKAITLGENRLRSETAGLFICQAAALLTP
ncbi:MAG: RsmE family RNA methyltransferase [Bacteroidota bacterium]